ncbi:putative immunoglobulin-blocking virulence protein [Mycoplasma sp. Pen4]|uniref:putative immunoglobulin-blocking virulence protein n=1 Tax=Mycoplasma sp. Pen4 TaxID=640330 RepID=UPI0016540013|nr:putative immunoglobulin-blocking virulence protein [Mycoplasma sp. Pen4]QNM93345.1 putative immunoglobulin-blocking virulence protein [Mycoplasma sp. Pen4]
MIKAKKLKYIKTAIIISGGILALAAAGLTVYSIKNKYIQRNNTKVLDDNDNKQSTISKVVVTFQPSYSSNTDVNADKGKAKKDDSQVKTTLIFKNSGTKEVVKKIEFYSQSDEALQMQIQNLIPNGYNFDPERYPNGQKIDAQLGSPENIIWVVPEKQNSETSFVFFTTDLSGNNSDETVVGTVTKQNSEITSTFDLSAIVPEGYEMVDSQNTSIKIGFTNRYFVAKVHKEVNVTLSFKDSSGAIIDKPVEVKTKEGENLNIIKYIPEGYKLPDGAQFEYPIAEDSKNIEITIEKIKQKVTSTINFIEIKQSNEKVIVKSQKVITEEGATIDYTNYMPDNYELADPDSQVTVTLGGVTDIYVKPIKKLVRTFIEFIDKVTAQSVGTPVNFESYEGDAIDYDPDWLPKGYKLASKENPTIQPGKTNKIFVIQISEPISITINYLWNGRIVSTRQVTGEKGQTIDAAKRTLLPAGYVIAEPEDGAQAQDTVITLDENNHTYQINVNKLNIVSTFEFINVATNEKVGQDRSIAKLSNETITKEDIIAILPKGYQLAYPDRPFVYNPGETTKILVSKIVKYVDTKIIFKTINGTEIASHTFRTVENSTEEIKWRDFLPKGYHVSGGLPLIELGKTIDIIVEKDSVIHYYSITFMYDGKVVETKNGTFADNNVPKIQELVPNGYVLRSKSQAQTFPIDSSAIIQVVPKQVEKPKQPEVTPEPVTPKDEKTVSEVLRQQGAYVNPDTLDIPDKKSSYPEPKDVNPSEFILQDQQERFDKLNKLIDSNVDFTAENLKDVYKEVYKRNPEWLEVFAKWLNGKSTIKFDGPQYTREQLREIMKRQMEAALEIAKSEAQKGRKISFEVSGNGWGFDIGFHFTYINEGDNPVFNRTISNNKKRVLKFNSKWDRNPEQILKNNFPGWNKYDASDTFNEITKSYERNQNEFDPRTGRQTSKDDGLRVYQYVPNGKDDVSRGQPDQFLLEVDASNLKGYNKFIEILKAHPEVTILRVNNIGLRDKNESLRNLLSQIPSNIQQVTLFFETTDTSAIAGLKDIHLQEVAVYTTMQNTDIRGRQRWGIDGVGFKNTAFVPYEGGLNKGWEDTSPAKRGASIQFDTIRPSRHDNFEDIKEGFDIILRVHQDWKVFNGSWGDQGWPKYIDLSLNPTLKSLKDIPLNRRVFRELKLHNDGQEFQLPFGEIVPGQFGALVLRGPDRAKLVFDNDDTNILHLTGSFRDIGDNFGLSLYGLLEAGRETFNSIIVDSQEDADFLSRTQAWGRFGSSYGGRIIVKK